jgi:hypothetical protein
MTLLPFPLDTSNGLDRAPLQGELELCRASSSRVFLFDSSMLVLPNIPPYYYSISNSIMIIHRTKTLPHNISSPKKEYLNFC